MVSSRPLAANSESVRFPWERRGPRAIVASLFSKGPALVAVQLLVGLARDSPERTVLSLSKDLTFVTHEQGRAGRLRRDSS